MLTLNDAYTQPEEGASYELDLIQRNSYFNLIQKGVALDISFDYVLILFHHLRFLS